ncbi:MAG: type 1 fimbrial protein, partial [Enterobacter asburiae]|nr:type 1 fimbrial protein [Enterobacter asburiae]
MMRTFLWLSGLMLTLPALSAENNLKITGNLVTEPGTLDLNSSDISLDFGNLVSKYFYTADRTP